MSNAPWTRLLAQRGPALAVCLLLVLYHATFAGFFASGARVAADYGLALPAMLAGHIWYRNVGLGEVPWFTPAFCGGQPYFADPQSGYYSALQAFTAWVDPLTAIYLTMLAFAGLGYLGMYWLLRRAFELGNAAAIFGAVVFMWNGFFAFRMLAGHLGYHGFMLVPWLAGALLVARPAALPPKLAETSLGVLAGAIAAYWVQSGLGTLLVPVGLSVAAICALRACLAQPPRLATFVLRATLGVILAGALSAAKVVAGLSFLRQVSSRSQYSLPGWQSAAAALQQAFTSLFVSPDDIERRAAESLRNAQWVLERPELEYGVTPVPLVIALAGAASAFIAWRRSRAAGGFGPVHSQRSYRRAAAVLVIGVIMLIPIALNVHAPDWNALLKRTPLLMSASTLVRWFCLYVPFVAVLGALGLSRLPATRQGIVSVLGCAVIVVLNLTQDRSGISVSPYDPGSITGAYAAIEAGELVPEIQEIAVMATADRQIMLGVNRNDAIAYNRSQLTCYNPVFGYRLESFPVRSLHPGPVRETADGYFNVKNPACYVFPVDNGCTPGEHFRVDQAAAMERFVHYRPFAFAFSPVQQLANAITQLALVLGALLLLATLGFLGAFYFRTNASR
jgi:hypothetical protein